MQISKIKILYHTHLGLEVFSQLFFFPFFKRKPVFFLNVAIFQASSSFSLVHSPHLKYPWER